ncbi:putative flippase GtrA [Sphingomonas kyeonggiensis]|uniref:Putative flippase GtrA n=1 Tax=Sphingomonas kyeonggiensis TaxID=1268553 RepID=A0A7W7K350_9SPHN|nr:GtrA family protein [Sphingomonas kyeonggiensis]MBB4839728.1 putative flippase GtrA [Sphingomonas kyeonggiensis]
MAISLSRERLIELWRYYQAGVVNTAFGLGAYALLVWLGLNMFVAQLVAHVAGVAFNYITYSRHVFRDAGPAKLRFTMSYVVNYLIGLATLACVALFIKSPYLAGLISAVLVSIINYFILKHFIFVRKPA